jgi:putative endonuclease
MKGYIYILECNDGSYYTGSTINLELRILQHQNGEGANYTKERLPVKLVYHEEFQRIDEAFYREKQVQRWSRKKKEALIKGDFKALVELARSPSTGSGTVLRHGSINSQPSSGTVLRQAQEPSFDMVR